MNQLRNYLHLYLGCTIMATEGNTAKPYHLSPEILYSVYVGEFTNVKLLLRPLSDMTEEEEKEAYTIRVKNSFNEFEGETVKYLLSKHFDIFGLIEAGLAINKNKQ